MTTPTVHEGTSWKKLPLPGRQQDVLVTGEHSKASNSEALFSLVMSMVNHGWDLTDCYQVLSDPTNEASRWVLNRTGRQAHRRRSAGEAYRAVERCFDKAVQRVAESPAVVDSVAALQEIGEIRGRFHSTQLTGRTAVTDTVVLEFIHREATSRRRVSLYLSVRAISEGTGFARGTVSNSVGRLIKLGWLSGRSGRDLVTQARYLRLTSPVARKVSQEWTQGRSPSTGREECVQVRDTAMRQVVDTSSHDLFIRYGRTCALIHAALTEDGLTAGELAKTLGVHRATVHRQLKRLAEWGLVTSTDTVWKATDKSLDDVAEETGAAGASDKRKAQYKREREQWSLDHERVQYGKDKDRWGKARALQLLLERRERTEDVAQVDVVDTNTGEVLDAPTEDDDHNVVAFIPKQRALQPNAASLAA